MSHIRTICRKFFRRFSVLNLSFNMNHFFRNIFAAFKTIVCTFDCLFTAFCFVLKQYYHCVQKEEDSYSFFFRFLKKLLNYQNNSYSKQITPFFLFFLANGITFLSQKHFLMQPKIFTFFYWYISVYFFLYDGSSI